MDSAEFQKVLSFSWNCEEMVPSAASHGATRPSYFGPDRPKFSSNGFAAWAGWLNTNRAPSAPSQSCIRPRRFKRPKRFNRLVKSRMALIHGKQVDGF